ncbi:MAG: response regulator transcription factor [Eggerthellaceae bacterium]|nr:response regulator transcription factor [Eggerthellaceae bacterium]
MIYYVEDEINIRELTIYALKQAGFEARGFAHATDFYAACKEELPEVVLLDIMLPDIDGLEILRTMRANPETQDIPVMMLTAKGTEFDKVVGLDAGADDYLAKPFGMMELASRVRALVRRAQRGAQKPIANDQLKVGPIVLDPAAHSVAVDGQEVVLTLKEFELLRVLMENEGRVLTRGQLLEGVWGVTYVGETRTVDVHVQTLRQKLGQALPGAEAMVATVRGVGYTLKKAH